MFNFKTGMFSRRAMIRAAAVALGTVTTAAIVPRPARAGVYRGQLLLFGAAHESYHPSRRANIAERIYAERWEKRNELSPGVNHGFGCLELILNPEENWGGGGFFGGILAMDPVSERVARVAASVVQWLGTNCGLAFVAETERLIAKEKGIEPYAPPRLA